MKTIISEFDIDTCVELVMSIGELGFFKGEKKELNIMDEEDIERALSKSLGRDVRLSEVDCTLSYCIPCFPIVEPIGMYLVFKVGGKWILDTELFVDEEDRELFYDEAEHHIYRLNGKELSLNEKILPVKEIFSFDPSAFHSFKINIDCSD